MCAVVFKSRSINSEGMNKLEQTILYLLKRCGKMTKDKLECLLYFCDFNYYEKNEKPMFKNIAWIKGKKHPKLIFKEEGKL